MKNTNIETAIIIRRPTRLEQLKSKFNTNDQAKFYIKQKKVAFKQDMIQKSAALFSKEEVVKQEKQAFEEAEKEYSFYELENNVFYNSLNHVEKKLSALLKVKILYQEYLPSYIFSPQDLIIVLGQDGLVANTAKYVGNLPIIGVNPDESRYDGVLLAYNPITFMSAVNMVIENSFTPKNITMAEVKLNDGQRLLAFNDFYVGINSHASAQYSITFQNKIEMQSSSGIIISTGAGSTGWLSSIFNMTRGLVKEFSPNAELSPFSFPKDSDYLMFAVREPFISRTSSAGIVVGKIDSQNILKLESNMPSNGVIFSDGIQQDFLEFNAGTIAEISTAKQKAVLV